MKRKEVVEKLLDAGICPDRLVAHKDGSFTFKKSFFYTHGSSSEKYADKIFRVIPEVQILECEDDWKEWPKTSYFVVKFKVD